MSSDNEDSMSICSSSASITSCPSSIIEEIQQLIDNFEETYKCLHNSIDILNSIRQNISNPSDIKITINNTEYDFESVLENIHTKCLEKAKEVGEMIFGEELLKTIDNSEFN